MVDTSILPVCDLFVTYSDWLILTYDDDYKRFYCRLVFCDKTATYEDLLKRGNFLSLKAFRTRCLAVEVYKCVHGLNPTYLNDLFTEPLANYNFRDKCRLHQPQFHTYTYGFRSFKYSGSKLWNFLPRAIKNTNDINEFKKNITEWCQTCDLSKLEIFWCLFPFQI